jgi:hypothetical protein
VNARRYAGTSVLRDWFDLSQQGVQVIEVESLVGRHGDEQTTREPRQRLRRQVYPVCFDRCNANAADNPMPVRRVFRSIKFENP